MPYWFEPTTMTVEVGGQEMTIETGRLAKQAQGSVLVTYGGTSVLVAATRSKPRRGMDFFPLTVDFIEKFAAAGRIPGGFFRREGRLADREVLVCRFIDRSIRPLFEKGYMDDTIITATVLSSDMETFADMAAFVGTSTALTISEIPFLGPIAAVRVGRVDGELVANPNVETLENSDLELIVAGSREALVMVEGGAQEVSEADMLAALKFGHEQCQPIIDLQEELRSKVGKEKIQVPVPEDTSELEKKVRELAQDRLDAAVQIRDKKERYAAIDEVESEVRDGFVSAYREEKVTIDSLEAYEERASGLSKLSDTVKNLLHDLRSERMRERVLGANIRIDGRKTDEVRPIACEVRAMPRPHGAALFTRGETQALVSATLGSGQDEQMIDAMMGKTRKTFMLHYNFPGFSVGEARPNRGPGRREVGHGHLAERAIAAALPDHEDFPYTIRLVSEILESNGSSSMASICGGTLALLDCGVPMKAPVAASRWG